jgi:hypothetical protein
MTSILPFLVIFITIVETSLIPQLGRNLSGLSIGLIIAIILMQKYDVSKGFVFFASIILLQAFTQTVAIDRVIINLILLFFLPIMIKMIFARRSLIAFNSLLFIVFALIVLLQTLGLNYNTTMITILISLIFANALYLNLSFFIVKI